MLHTLAQLWLLPQHFSRQLWVRIIFFYLDFLQRKECQKPNLKEFPGAEFSDGPSSPSNPHRSHSPREGGDNFMWVCYVRMSKMLRWGWGGRTRLVLVMEGKKFGSGVRDPSVDSLLLRGPEQAIPLWASSPHKKGLTRSLPVLSSCDLHFQLGTSRKITTIYWGK